MMLVLEDALLPRGYIARDEGLLFMLFLLLIVMSYYVHWPMKMAAGNVDGSVSR